MNRKVKVPRSFGRSFICLALLLCLLSGMFPTRVYATVKELTTEVVNQIRIGNISIRVDMYGLNEAGEEIAWQGNPEVLPGDTVDQIIRITNVANPAWIRAKVISVTDNGTDLSDEVLFRIADTKWKKIGEYYYYLEPVDEDQAIDLLDQIYIPGDWKHDQAGAGFSMDIRVDAVQQANFTPDFTSDDPWFGTLIEESVYTDKAVTTTGNSTFSVVYENRAEGFVRTGDDFFSNFADLMPGDVVSDTVEVKNNYKDPTTIYFRTDYDTPKDDVTAELLQKIQLTIELNGKTVYTGAMSADTLKKGITLGTFNKGEGGTLTYTLSVPAELNNRYALQGAGVKWIFSTNYEVSIPKTGDDTMMTLWILLLAGSACVAASLMLAKKKASHRRQG